MAVVEKIQACIEELPEPLQVEVLRFAESLKSSIEEESAVREDRQWSELSLKLALRGMEHEGSFEYSAADLKEEYS